MLWQASKKIRAIERLCNDYLYTMLLLAIDELPLLIIGMHSAFAIDPQEQLDPAVDGPWHFLGVVAPKSVRSPGPAFVLSMVCLQHHKYYNCVRLKGHIRYTTGVS